MRCRKASLFFLRRLGVTNFVRAISPFNLARAQKSNSIQLYYNTSRTSSQEEFQIFFFRTFVRTEHMFFQIFIFVKFLLSFSVRVRAVKFFRLSNFQISCKRAVKKLRPGAANELQIFSFFKFPGAANFISCQILRRPRSFIKK